MSKKSKGLPYTEIEPGKAKALPWSKIDKLLGDDEWVVEEKLDGWRYLMHIGGRLDRMYLTGRNVSKETGRFSEKGLFAPQLAPPPSFTQRIGYTVLDGEVMPPHGAHFRDIAGIMNVKDEAAARTRTKQIGSPIYYAFDILFHDGEDVRDLSYLSRRELLHDVIKLGWLRAGSDLAYEVPFTPGDAARAYYDALIADGGEGVMLKNVTHSYARQWIKVKRRHTIDVVITGFTDAKEGKTGKFKGLIGAAKIGVYDKSGRELIEVGQVSGMNDEMRVWMTKHRYKLPYRQVIEVFAQEIARDRLRHPRFHRLRDDITPAVCTMVKMKRDLKADKPKEK